MSKEQTRIYNGDSKVIRFFEDLSAIPRESGNEKAISDYIVRFAEERGCTVSQDQWWNLIIKKPAAKGYEKAPTVIFQGHLDMVCEKNKSTQHDFTKDPIKLKIDGEMMYAQDTTLGADNGIAVAFAMALMDAKDADHPELEILLTTQEETSMAGALNIDVTNLQGRMLINLDSDTEGTLYVSSAGGMSAFHSVPIRWEDKRQASSPYIISVKGLLGGHSGEDIIKQRGNANQLLGRVLDDLRRNGVDYNIAHISGGIKVNAIPREAEAVVYVNEAALTHACERVAVWNGLLQDEFEATDPQIAIELKTYDNTSAALTEKRFSAETKNKVIHSLLLIRSGVFSMNKSIDNLVRSSSNIGSVKTSEAEVVIESLVRSSLRSQLDLALYEMEALAEALGCSFRADHYFPGWPYRPESKLRDTFAEVYLRNYGKPMKIKAIHAGLECGILIEKMPYLDVVSYGPDMYNFHTPEEHFRISSVERTWDYLTSVLREIKE
ncbi:aminoacyl-histidine dipeptidase [Paenibacillus baekrokdamisoli]|uniref:Cytosol non-specific dipeptidase n=1 Tax=Paenibacillus baekrokdamisoli TaxID=1712516 RepID=A0A3G9JMQ9_9BACL|nr:aminoacyl-histidine dipeptidase [Paenibacillus baekrokdamisoli]MBB3071865.1 dipeptidase D [Paenibacillus baekrokdamisoli]BBH24154.1 aminoacyl-histidine dipeptidase [Paenibacillus baekrokdamisoli]